MSRRIPGLSHVAAPEDEVKNGEYLVRVVHAHYHWDKKKPFYTVKFSILEPLQYARHVFNARIYCSAKALWKLNWFLKDFGYDPELLGRDELDDKALCGLVGVVKTENKVFNGRSVVSLEAFAPSDRWTSTSVLQEAA